jgi:hypothetical protein
MRETTAPDLGSGLSKTGRTRLYSVIYIPAVSAQSPGTSQE